MPESHPHSVIDPDETGDMTIVMRANKEPSDLRADMMRYYSIDHPSL